VIDVRPDEGFDEVRLAEFLRGKLEGSELPLSVRQFAGGHANLTYLLQYGEGDARFEYVLRRPPLGPVAKTAHDMKREYRALSKLWRFFEPAPRAFLFSDDHSLIGADFFVMERRHGIVVRREIPPELGSGQDLEINRKLSEVVIDALTEFHTVDPVASGPIAWSARRRGTSPSLTSSHAGCTTAGRPRRRRRCSTTTGGSTTWPWPRAIQGAVRPSSTGTCARWVTRCATSVP
jgi:aminoglycoside phosphotransferase (APT) family kinase protein